MAWGWGRGNSVRGPGAGEPLGPRSQSLQGEMVAGESSVDSGRCCWRGGGSSSVGQRWDDTGVWSEGWVLLGSGKFLALAASVFPSVNGGSREVQGRRGTLGTHHRIP